MGEAPGSEITVCSWRITKADPSGFMMWFDPQTEVPMLMRAKALGPPSFEDGHDGKSVDGTDEKGGGSSFLDLPF